MSAFGQDRKFPLHGRKTPANAKSFDHMVKDCGFPAPEQIEEKTTGNGKNSPWKYPNLYAPSSQEECNLFQRNANAPMFASLVRGTTPRPIVYYLPEVRSLFPIDVWRDPLRTYPDRDFVRELLHDINFGVPIGFNHDRTPSFPQITVPQPLNLRPSHRNWNTNCP